MDVRFLREISDAYRIDNELDTSTESIFKDVYEIATYLREYDIDLYNELYESSKLYQNRVIKGYLDYLYDSVKWTPDGEELISEEALSLTIGGVTLAKMAASVLITLTSIAYRKPITKFIMSGISTLGRWIENMGKFLTTHGNYMQLRYSIIQENTRKCYVKCGVQDPSKIDISAYFNLRSGTSTYGTKESISQGLCLRDCYIENLIDVIALHMECYFACLKKTGGFDAISKTDSDDIMKMISSVNLGATCESFYNAAKEALDNFNKTLEFVFNKQYDEDKRFAAINKLRERIYQARQTIQRANPRELGRYGSGPQQK